MLNVKIQRTTGKESQRQTVFGLSFFIYPSRYNTSVATQINTSRCKARSELEREKEYP